MPDPVILSVIPGEAVLLAGLQAYSKTIDLIVSLRADMTQEQRTRDATKHFERIEKAEANWGAFVQWWIGAFTKKP